MRMKSDRQLHLDFGSNKKIVRKFYSKYALISDALDEMPEVLEAVHKDITSGIKKRGTNVEGVSSETILRMAAVKHIEELTFRDLIVRIADSNMLSFFCRVYDDALIDFTTFAKLYHEIRPETWQQINEVLQKLGRDKKGIKGKKLRTDTTAVETNIHRPTDSSLLFDCVRVLSRLLVGLRNVAPAMVGGFRSRVKDAKRLAVAIGREKKEPRRKKLYRKLLPGAQRAVDHSRKAIKQIEVGIKRYPQAIRIMVLEIRQELETFCDLTEQCIDQARRRVIEDETVPNEEKVFSIFEPHTELLIRGKADKPIEYGHMVEINQSEEGLITGYAVYEKRPVEPDLLTEALNRHKELFGHFPDILATDKGFYRAKKVKELEKLGVKLVAIAKKGKRNEDEVRVEHGILFRAAQRFRAGIEGAISNLKRTYGLTRCLNRGWQRFQSWVGAAVFARNLVWLVSG